MTTHEQYQASGQKTSSTHQERRNGLYGPIIHQIGRAPNKVDDGKGSYHQPALR